MTEFGKSFKSADQIIITDIYASAREKEATTSGQELSLEIRKVQHGVKYISEWYKIVQEVIDNIKKPAVVVTMGAGDIYKLQDQIQKELKNG
jgi:UDP-N-acetylmuramate--alanine ligase